METSATCIQPKPDITEETTVETSEREVWFSDIPGAGFELTYKADSNQITFLQMLSSKASQNITYHCSNSVAYYNEKRDNHRKAVALMSWNDLEIRHQGKFKYQVPLDECQVWKLSQLCTVFTLMMPAQLYLFLQFGKDEWAKTILSLKDIKPTRLPIVDVAVRDVGNKRQKFKLEIGQVCFT
jgi:collagen type II alpha